MPILPLSVKRLLYAHRSEVNIPNKADLATTPEPYVASSGLAIPEGCGRGMGWLSEQGAGVASHWVMGISCLTL